MQSIFTRKKRKKKNSFQLLFFSYCAKTATKAVEALVLSLTISQSISGLFSLFFTLENMEKQSLNVLERQSRSNITSLTGHHDLGGLQQNPFLHLLLTDSIAASKQNDLKI